MGGDIINKQARAAFREHFVGWTLATMATEFESIDVPCDSDYQAPCSGARRFGDTFRIAV